MKKAIIFCYSIHHGNTRKIAEAIRVQCGAEVVLLPCKELPNLEAYDLVGFASGIYFSAFGRPIAQLVDHLDGLEGKVCFTLYTSGAASDQLDRSFLKKLESKGARVAGRFNCRGFDSYGPFGLVGGIRKNHPDSKDMEAGVRFCEGLMNE